MIDSARQIRYTVICKENTGFNGEEFLWNEKAAAEIVLFDNSDVITTSGLDGTNDGDCLHGQSKGNCYGSNSKGL